MHRELNTRISINKITSNVRPIVKIRARQVEQCSHNQPISSIFLFIRQGEKLEQLESIERTYMAYFMALIMCTIIVASFFTNYPYMSILPIIILYCTRRSCTVCLRTTIYDPHCTCTTCGHVFCDACARTNLIYLSTDDYTDVYCVNRCKKTAGIKRIRAWVHRMKMRKVVDPFLPNDIIDEIVFKYI